MTDDSDGSGDDNRDDSDGRDDDNVMFLLTAPAQTSRH